MNISAWLKLGRKYTKLQRKRNCEPLPIHSRFPVSSVENGPVALGPRSRICPQSIETQRLELYRAASRQGSNYFDSGRSAKYRVQGGRVKQCVTYALFVTGCVIAIWKIMNPKKLPMIAVTVALRWKKTMRISNDLHLRISRLLDSSAKGCVFTCCMSVVWKSKDTPDSRQGQCQIKHPFESWRISRCRQRGQRIAGS